MLLGLYANLIVCILLLRIDLMLSVSDVHVVYMTNGVVQLLKIIIHYCRNL